MQERVIVVASEFDLLQLSAADDGPASLAMLESFELVTIVARSLQAMQMKPV